MGDPRDTTKPGQTVQTLYGSASWTGASANSPAGGGGNGYFTSRLPHGRSSVVGYHHKTGPEKGLLDSITDTISDTWDGLDCVMLAKWMAELQAPQAIIDETGRSIEELEEGLIPGLLAAGAVVALFTVVGGVVGAIAGALPTFGVGAAAGASVGAKVGFDVGLTLVTWLGLGFLIVHIASSLGQVTDAMKMGVWLAWSGRGRPPLQRTIYIHMGSKKMAQAIGIFFRLLLEAIVMYLLEKGTAAAAARLSELMLKLKASKLGEGFAEWVGKNFKSLIEDPKINPYLKGKKGGTGGGSSEAPTTSSGSKSSTKTKQEPVKPAGKEAGEKPRLPVSDGEWTGTPGNSGWKSTKPEVNAVTGGEPVPFKNNNPDFSKWTEKDGTAKINVTGDNSKDFRQADKIFAERKGWLKSDGTPNASAAARYRQQNELTWHHVEDMETMQLVPRALNDIPHSGGAAGKRNQ